MKTTGKQTDQRGGFASGAWLAGESTINKNMNDQEMHDLKKTRELIEAVKSVCESKPQLDDADVRGILYMMRDAVERVSRTLRDTLPPEQDERRTLLFVERVAQLTAHRAIGNQESDPQNGKIPGYCAVCQVPWPCPVSLRPVLFAEPVHAADVEESVYRMPNAKLCGLRGENEGTK